MMRSRELLVAALAIALASCGRKHGDTPTDPLLRFPLSVVIAGDGHVTSTPDGIDCVAVNGANSGACQAEFLIGTVVRLEAVAANGQVLDHWSGACSGATSCDVALQGTASVTALFAVVQRTLQLRLTTPNGSDGIVMMTLTGPSITAVRPRAGVDLVTREHVTATGQVETTIIATGSVATGTLADIDVRGGPATGPVTGDVTQAAAGAAGRYARRTSLAGYSVVASP